MGEKLIRRIIISPLKKINVKGGDVYHCLKASEESYKSFGEAYFSFVEPGTIKAWKKHSHMTLNLIVPIGKIEFVMFDENHKDYQSEILSPQSYNRLTIPPNIWFGFKGISNSTSMLLNIADIEHDPEEVDRMAEKEIDFNWSN